MGDAAGARRPARDACRTASAPPSESRHRTGYDPAVPDARTLSSYAVQAAERATRYEAADLRGLHARMVAACPRDARALDVGCGSGRDVAFLIREGRVARGVDASTELLAEARRRHPEAAAALAEDSLPALASLGDARFELVTATAVLMHLGPAELFPALQRLRSFLEPGGTLLVSVPNEPESPGPEHRDADGRLFWPHAPGEVRLSLERLGLACTWDRAETDGLGRRRVWRVMAFRASGRG